MKTDFSSGASWNSAAKAGLVMGLATIALMLVTSLTGKVEGMLGWTLNCILTILKITVCIVLFKKLMTRFANAFKDVTTKGLYNYGLKIALLSAIIVSAYMLITLTLTDPEVFNEAIEQAMETYSSMLDSNEMAAMENITSKLPAVMFFFSLVYCFIWGWILSAVFSRSIVPDDPFSGSDN